MKPLLPLTAFTIFLFALSPVKATPLSDDQTLVKGGRASPSLRRDQLQVIVEQCSGVSTLRSLSLVNREARDVVMGHSNLFQGIQPICKTLEALVRREPRWITEEIISAFFSAENKAVLARGRNDNGSDSTSLIEKISTLLPEEIDEDSLPTVKKIIYLAAHADRFFYETHNINHLNIHKEDNECIEELRKNIDNLSLEGLRNFKTYGGSLPNGFLG